VAPGVERTGLFEGRGVAIVTGIATAKMSGTTSKAPLSKQAANLLQQAHKLPRGQARDALLELARGLLKLHGAAFRANIHIVEKPTAH
jgi:hypothetical protein